MPWSSKLKKKHPKGAKKGKYLDVVKLDWIEKGNSKFVFDEKNQLAYESGNKEAAARYKRALEVLEIETPKPKDSPDSPKSGKSNSPREEKSHEKDHKHHKDRKRPNILFVMVDEMRFPPVYETKEIKEWRRKYLKAQEKLKQEGVEFLNHFTGTTACSPSRATIFTGQYPSLHGVSQTDGSAKSAYDPTMFWLDENTVPDTGDYFRAGGYRTIYKGKWHISAQNILIPGTKNAFLTYDDEGFPIPSAEAIYLNGDRLGKFGFEGWVGPDPHGSSAQNSGSSSNTTVDGRDIVYTEEVVKLLAELKEGKDSDSKSAQAPWFLVASLVNPHDIALYGELSKDLPSFKFTIDPSVPCIPPAPTADEDLSTKPVCQGSYKTQYQQGFQPTIDNETYRQLYYSLNLTADRNIQKILDALKVNGFDDNTVVVFTSDHGDYVGAHGLFQKWYTAYQEAIHVPLIIRLPAFKSGRCEKKERFPRAGTKVKDLTSHLDLLPTLLGLGEVNVKKVQKELSETHNEVHPLVGRDLTPLLFGKKLPDEPVLFMTWDNVLLGPNMTTLLGKPYTQVLQPTGIETVITHLPVEEKQDKCHEHKSPRSSKRKLWKYSRYYDNPQFWSNPGISNTVTVQQADVSITPTQSAGLTTTTTSVLPVPDQFEMYNLSDDPLETKNLANPAFATPETLAIQKVLAVLLAEQIKKKLIFPSSGPVPGAPGQKTVEPGILPRPG